MNCNFEKRFAAHVIMFDCDQFILRMIENCAPFVEKIYVAYSELAWVYNPKAREKFKNTTNKDILKQSRYFSKVELIEGAWAFEEDARNACLERARADGFDYLIIHDVDEFYTREGYKNNIDGIIDNPGWDLYVTPWCSFWKNLDYVVESNEGSIIVGYPQFAVNCKSAVKFTEKRAINTNKSYRLTGLCYHLSYVLTNEQVYRKINTWSHTHEFDTASWYRRKWLTWHEDSQNLHPVTPEAWKRAVRFKGKLPADLVGFEAPKVVLYNPTLKDKIGDFYLKLNNTLGKCRHLSYNILFRFIHLFKATTFKILGERGRKVIDHSLIKLFSFFKTAPVNLYRRIFKSLTWKVKVAMLLKSPGGLKLHLGCGDQNIKGMCNCEYRPTKAADVVMDCGRLSRFKDNSVSLVFSHAFFEHCYRKLQLPLLKDCYRILKKNDGVLIFLGIPDFEVIAESYLNRVPGHPGRSDVFDLYQVYRYSHGDPEMTPTYWIEQLHKSLFDKKHIKELLSMSRFNNWAIFNYCYPGENIPLNLGFVAWKSKPVDQRKELKELLSLFDEQQHCFANIDEPLRPDRLTVSAT